jgi:RNA polymerase sigma factor (sigma-70 family)
MSNLPLSKPAILTQNQSAPDIFAPDLFAQDMSAQDTSAQDQLISAALRHDEPRLRSFIRRHVTDSGDAEDILQDVLYELIAAYRLMQPIEHVSAWLFRVARNRIIDLFRKKKPSASLSDSVSSDEDESLSLEDLLPSPDDGPDAAYLHSLLLTALDEAIDELPANQREVFLAHEVEGRSFKEIAAETGVGVNTLLSRKRYAVLHLRERLQFIYTSFLSN